MSLEEYLIDVGIIGQMIQIIYTIVNISLEYIFI
jgi:hypothetical protein